MIIGLILTGAGCLKVAQEQPKDEKKQVQEEKKIEETNNQENKTEEIDTSDWLTYTNEEYGFSFRYPKGWFIIEDESISRIYIRNVQGNTNKGNRPSDYQQIWISTWEKEITADTENNVKIGKPDGIEFGGGLFISAININGFIINTYEYNTLGGKILQAFWNDKSGKRYYATNSTEVGQENQQKMVENLKKILTTFEFIK
ncbi:MAG: hypothetical protein A2725_03060 [Candidatus Magasanikbacteria bacterium RIFCSPHIGHO2_01_FULL_33_34]|uniref:Uncharacterized protein n=1 Tax=Candidatus Magasanikbacteria bacterium RIFCSPHIGHO2_01_FULL_33_34 TaxID=1798671 RepID=A0A1F6LHA5_9BACT|nr:MAG: hypothetical protein A2725_03060 [Candidatus Magasanikbacteria bacterium RIFCSPHIGHO2_01_FULL_33_34]OGH82444.1 MAG: hypothetical protein A3F93_04380 [Candidatus Magasanikbacteria bacterium RIFCSPLOWO2_12_FULL_34_7]